MLRKEITEAHAENSGSEMDYDKLPFLNALIKVSVQRDIGAIHPQLFTGSPTLLCSRTVHRTRSYPRYDTPSVNADCNVIREDTN